MIVHPEELALARAYTQAHPFEGLTQEQMNSIMDRGRALFHWFKDHPGLHNLIGAAVLVFLFGADFLALAALPHWLLPAGANHTTARTVLVAILAGGMHSWLMYSMTVYSMHEGAAHNVIFTAKGRLGAALRFLAGNLCRLAASEPIDYSANHMSHHARFGTPDDGELLNFVRPRRYWPTLLPLAAFLNYSDFIAHRPARYTASRIVSAALSLAYNVPYAVYLYRSFGTLFMVVAMLVVFPHFGFYLDRLRQFTEHNLMPLENRNGSRSFGAGFWGMLVGAGPWGSPCHWEHHLVASLPWYQQLLLHRHVVRLLTPRQREQFLIEPVVGFPRLWWRLWRDAGAFEKLRGG
jgi:hypothetical protein